MVKDKINLMGVKETMLIPLYARAWASRRKNPDFIDPVALKIIDSIDYDFKQWKGSKMNIWGCAGRTVILDNYVRDYVRSHPVCSIVNLACGLDDRFSRVDNSQIKWYNIDFKEVIDIRENIIEESPRVHNIACNMFDTKWMDEIKGRDNLLVIAEGVLMYVKKEDAKVLFDKISEKFSNVTLLLELMPKWMVDNQKLHDVTKKTSNSFIWGVESSKEVENMCPQYKYIDECNITDYMKPYSRVFITLISKILAPKNNRIVKYELKSN